MKKLIIILILIIVILSSCKSSNTEEGSPLTFDFYSNDGRMVKVEYTYKSLKAELWDGKTIFIPQVTSASGARYASSKYTLWNKGNEITLWQNNKVIFKGTIK